MYDCQSRNKGGWVMKFKSKTALAEHIKELERDGYLISEWITKTDGLDTIAYKAFKINYDAVKKDEKN